MRHGAWRRDLLNFESDGVGFVNAHPDWKHHVAANIFEKHDGHVGDRIHHEATNFHFDFHKDLERKWLAVNDWWLAGLFAGFANHYPLPTALYHFSHQTVWEARRHAHVHVASSLQFHAFRRCKVQHLDLRSPTDPLAAGRVLPFHHHLGCLPQVPLITMRLDLPLFLVEHG